MEAKEEVEEPTGAERKEEAETGAEKKEEVETGDTEASVKTVKEEDEDWGNWKSDGTRSSEPIPLPHFDFRPWASSRCPGTPSRDRKPSGLSSRGRKPSGPASRDRKPSGPSSRGRKPSGPPAPAGKPSNKKKREKEKRRKERLRMRKENQKKCDEQKKENEQKLTKCDQRNLRKRQIFDTEMRAREIWTALKASTFDPTDLPEMLQKALARTGCEAAVKEEKDGESMRMVGTIANLGIQVATPLPTEVDRWPGAIVMAKQTIYSMLLLHVSLAFATKAKEVFSAEDPQAALRKLKSESLPQASPSANKRKASVLKHEDLEKSDEEKHLIQVIYKFLSVPKEYKDLARAPLVAGYSTCLGAWNFLRKDGKINFKGSFVKYLRNLPYLEVGDVEKSNRALVKYRNVSSSSNGESDVHPEMAKDASSGAAKKRKTKSEVDEEEQLVQAIYDFLSVPKQFRRLATAQLLDPYPNCAEAWSFLRKNGKILRPGNSFGKWLRQIPHIEVGDLTGDGQGLVTYQPDDFRPPTAKHRAVPTQSAARMLRAALPRTTSAMMALPAPPAPTSAWMELPAPPVPHGLRCVPAKQNDKVEGADTDTSEVFFV